MPTSPRGTIVTTVPVMVLSAICMSNVKTRAYPPEVRLGQIHHDVEEVVAGEYGHGVAFTLPLPKLAHAIHDDAVKGCINGLLRDLPFKACCVGLGRFDTPIVGLDRESNVIVFLRCGHFVFQQTLGAFEAGLLLFQFCFVLLHLGLGGLQLGVEQHVVQPHHGRTRVEMLSFLEQDFLHNTVDFRGQVGYLFEKHRAIAHSRRRETAFRNVGDGDGGGWRSLRKSDAR